MLEALYHRFALLVLAVAVVSTVWFVGWADQLQTEEIRGHFPVLPVHVDGSPKSPQVSLSESPE